MVLNQNTLYMLLISLKKHQRAPTQKICTHRWKLLIYFLFTWDMNSYLERDIYNLQSFCFCKGKINCFILLMNNWFKPCNEPSDTIWGWFRMVSQRHTLTVNIDSSKFSLEGGTDSCLVRHPCGCLWCNRFEKCRVTAVHFTSMGKNIC